jgi:D-glycero-D-manno-heptose 1,7-bisphosphate phosphatase
MNHSAARAVFLDRDGVLNRAVLRNGRPFPPASAADTVLFAGVGEACERLRDQGFQLVVVTNQPDIARGAMSAAAVHEINEKLQRALPIDQFRLCPHDDGDGCRCRKPAPGLLVEAARDLGLSLTKSFMVGDRWRDVEAGRRAGCRTVFINHGYEEEHPDRPDTTVGDLSEAVDWIVAVTIREEADLRA